MIALSASFLAAAPVAFAAGLISFLSPCILPLLPGYLAFTGGVVGGEATSRRRGRAVLGALCFVAGFTVVFLTTGYLFGGVGRVLHGHQRVLEIVFGAVTVLLGVVFAGWLPSSWLERERRSHFLPRATLVGAFVLGFLFALGWTPCVGPTLAAILGLAATSGASAWRGTGLALVYCAGLGVPFVVAAMAGEWATTVSSRVRRHARVVAIVGGVMLIMMGAAEISGVWQHVVVWLQGLFPSTALPL